MSKIEVDAIEPQSGTTLTLGASGDTIALGSGATLGAGMGKVLQVVSTTKVDTFSASLAAGAATAITGLSASITPSSTSNKILIFVVVSGNNGSETGVAFTIKRDSTEILIPSAGTGIEVSGIGLGITTGVSPMSNGMHGIDEPNTTSSVTYSVTITNFASITRTVYVNTSASPEARSPSTITLMEIAG